MAFNQQFERGSAVVLNERSQTPGVGSFILGPAEIRMLPMLVVPVAGHGFIPIEHVDHGSGSIDIERDE